MPDGASEVYDDVGFVELERDVVRKYVPNFDYLSFDAPTSRSRPRAPLSAIRVGLVGTAGVHLPDQPAIGTNGDVREIPMDAGQVRLTHPGYDTARASADPEVVFPRGILRALESKEFIGSTPNSAISTMGFVPDGRKVLDETVPAVLDWVDREQVDLALLVPA